MRIFWQAHGNYMSKRSIIRGTFILAVTGIITRLIGFVYRIFLSNVIGTIELGIYQMIFPVFGVCSTIYGAGIQTAISQITASVSVYEHSGNKTAEKSHVKISSRVVLLGGILLSLCLSLLLMGFIEWKANFIAERFLMEPRCAQPLRILAVLFPFCGVGSCIHGWYYGKQKTGIPAASQLLEQCIRVSVVYVMSSVLSNYDIISGSELAVIGMCAGEIMSCIFIMTALFFSHLHGRPVKLSETAALPAAMRKLLHTAIPLTGNRLIVNILASAEAVLIPAALRSYGLSSEEALSLYGILTGMSLPFLMFPSTITGSLSVMLLPTVAQATSSGDMPKVRRTCSLTIRFCLLLGFSFLIFFLFFGNLLGNIFYHNTLAGKYLTVLAWLCPFLYVTPTLGSILNGMNKAHITLCNNVTGMGVRLLFVLFRVPHIGMQGYLSGLLVSQLITFFLDLYAISKEL